MLFKRGIVIGKKDLELEVFIPVPLPCLSHKLELQVVSSHSKSLC